MLAGRRAGQRRAPRLMIEPIRRCATNTPSSAPARAGSARSRRVQPRPAGRGHQERARRCRARRNSDIDGIVCRGPDDSIPITSCSARGSASTRASPPRSTTAAPARSCRSCSPSWRSRPARAPRSSAATAAIPGRARIATEEARVRNETLPGEPAARRSSARSSAISARSRRTPSARTRHMFIRHDARPFRRDRHRVPRARAAQSRRA